MKTTIDNDCLTTTWFERNVLFRLSWKWRNRIRWLQANCEFLAYVLPALFDPRASSTFIAMAMAYMDAYYYSSRSSPSLPFRSRSSLSPDWQIYLREASLVARGKPLHLRGSLPLTVLDNKIDAPCIGCGGRCCTRPKGEAGFDVLVIDAWEPFAKIYRHLIRPHRVRANQFYMDMGHRCPFLSPEGLCGVYSVRPLACRQFNCVDGLAQNGTCATEFVREVPIVRERLERLGFKAPAKLAVEY